MKLVAKVWKAHIFNIKQNHSYQAATTNSKQTPCTQKSEGWCFSPKQLSKWHKFHTNNKKINSLKEKSNKVLCKKSSPQFHEIKYESLGKRDKGENREI